MRAALAVGCLGAVAALVAGCASIPTASTVRQGDEVLSGGQDDPFIRVLARPPVDGMSQRQIVAGFLEASASFDGDHEVARQYLAPEVRGSWDPSSGTVVYDGSSVVFSEDPAANTVVVRAPEVARISDRGEYAASGPGVALAADFALRLVDDEWRIAAAPAGLALTTLDVSRAFRAYNLYFLDPTGSRLVPDQVFVPVQQSGIATTLVRSVLLGPTPWLAPAVSTAVPPGTSLTVDSVPVDERVARVDLSSEALDSAPEARERMSAQLVWTLRQLPEVSQIDLTVNGVDLQVPGVANPQSRNSWPEYDPDGFPAGGPPGYAVLDGALVTLGDPGDPGDPTTPTTPPSRSPGRWGRGARRSAGPRSAPRGIGSPRWSAATGSWPAPWTRLSRSPESAARRSRRCPGTRWAPCGSPSSGQQGRSSRRWASTGCPERWPPRSWPAGRSPWCASPGMGVAPRSSPRVPSGGAGQLYLARVVRGADGALALEALRRVESSLVSVSDAAWRDADRIVALARDGRGVEQPFLVSGDGGAVRITGTLPGLTSLAAAPGSPLLGATADGRLWADNGTGWSLLGPGQAPAYPG